MHYSMYAESHPEGVGTQYVEVRGDCVVRQIVEFGGQLYWSHAAGFKDERHMFTDQPEWLDGDGAIDLHSITAEEFEVLWQRAAGPPITA